MPQKQTYTQSKEAEERQSKVARVYSQEHSRKGTLQIIPYFSGGSSANMSHPGRYSRNQGGKQATEMSSFQVVTKVIS